jgi:hypothetical protein
MKLYLRIILILAISFFALALFNKAYQKGHIKYYQHETERINMLLNKETYYDILFIGSSRMHVHCNPKVIDSITKLTSYNFGVEGGNLLETNLWLQVYLQLHKAPKVIVLDIPVFAFDIGRRPFFNPTIYFPYLSNDIIYNTIAKYKKIGLYKYLPFLQLMEVDDYNKFNALKGWAGGKEELASHFTYNGYADNGENILKPSTRPPHDTTTYKITETGMKLFNAIIDTCIKKNIKLMLIYSPEYFDIEYSTRVNFFSYINNTASKNDLPFFDYRKSPISRDSILFANPGHLNKFGADIFSKDVAQRILYETK